MVLRKHFRRQGRKFNRFLRGASKAVNIASTALSVAQGVASLINVEKKYHDTWAAATAVNTTAAINCITAVPQGDDNNNREGNKVKLTSAQARFYFKWNGDEVDTKYSQRCRLLILRDLQNNSGNTPAIGDILQSTANAQQLMQSPIALSNGKRFQILKDQVYSQDNERGGVNVDWYYKFNDLTKNTGKMNKKTDPHLTWKTSSATTYNQGHIWIVLIGDIASGSATATCEYGARVRFVDN